MATNNPGIRTKVMDMLKGLRTIDKVFTAASGATGEIEAGMLCSASPAGAGSASAVTLVKGYAGVGVPYFAYNNYFDNDAMSMTNSTMGDGSGVGSRIVAIPGTGAVELVIPLAKIDAVNTDGFTVGDKVVPAFEIAAEDLTFTADGKIAAAPAAADFLANGTVGEVPYVGVITEVRANALVIYPLDGTKTLVGAASGY